MTNKEKMLRMVLEDKDLQEIYDYNQSDYKDSETALRSENVCVAAVAQIIYDLNGSTEESEQKKVYKTIYQYIKDNLK